MECVTVRLLKFWTHFGRFFFNRREILWVHPFDQDLSRWRVSSATEVTFNFQSTDVVQAGLACARGTLVRRQLIANSLLLPRTIAKTGLFIASVSSSSTWVIYNQWKKQYRKKPSCKRSGWIHLHVWCGACEYGRRYTTRYISNKIDRSSHVCGRHENEVLPHHAYYNALLLLASVIVGHHRDNLVIIRMMVGNENVKGKQDRVIVNIQIMLSICNSTPEASKGLT